ncbi:efflux RND transporter periplasmic adaptor subunit [Piscinibacterium candidicorallinum]|uniref:Efflux RND transporter periplasmic adaptor subunit n=1 Tax=Piscinibacterium candidicorallinum TaxID=1793872 RepID=A0ABV7H302_9BURK
MTITHTSKRARSPRRALYLVATAAAAVALLAACGKSAAPPQEDIRPVRTITVGTGQLGAGAVFAAEIRPRVEQRLSFRVGGKMTERLVELGTPVKPGQVLARLDPKDLQLAQAASAAQVAAAKANLELAQAELKRTQELAKQNFVSGSRVDQAETQMRAARAQFEAAQAQANVQGNQAAYAALTADKSGVVVGVDAEAGQVLSAGQSVVRVAVGSERDVVFNLPEQAARALRPGVPVSVSLWANPAAPIKAVVREVAPAADPVARVILVRASLQDPEGLATLGATATVSLPADPRAAQAISVPLAALVQGDAGPSVWVVKDGAAARVPVKLTGNVGNQVLIGSGLSAGQQVITAGIHTIREGQKVKLMPGVAAAASATAVPAASAAPAAAK